MLEKYKNILHISWIRHQIIDDIFLYRKEKLETNDELILWNENFNEFYKFDDYNIILFHFINKLDIDYILELFLKYPNKKYWLYLHTFYPFCEDWTFLSSKFTNSFKLLKFIDNLEFIIVQDNFSFSLVKNFLKKENISNTKIFYFKQPIIKKEVISNKNISNKFRLWFVGAFSYIKWFDTIKKIINNFWTYFDKIWIDIKLFTLKNPWENINLDKIYPESKSIGNIKITYNEFNRKKIYSQIDCLIIPSIWNETGPMVLYEAFANKIPVIVSDQESLKEKIIDRVDSYVFKTWDERDLLKWILWIKDNYEKIILNKKWFQYNTIENFNIELNNFLNEL